MSSSGKPEICVVKTPEIMAAINRFRAKDNPRYLSASSIKQYVGCPMSFYFEKIAHYRREDEINDWMDESTMGTVVHDVFEHLFGELLHGAHGRPLVTAAVLEDMRDNTARIDRLICRAVNEYYRKLGKDSYEPLSGDTKILGLIIKENIREVLRKEQAHVPFCYIQGEWEGEDAITLRGSDGKELTFNFKCFIDRVDRYIGTDSFPRVRVIDYKTGSDDTEVVSLEQIFQDFKKKAFLQVMLYAQAYAQFTHCNEPIQPMIYAMRSIMVNDIKPLGVPCPDAAVERDDLKRPATPKGKWRLLDYRDYETAFNDLLIPYLEELFNPDVPFRCADNEDACKYCAFKAICRKENK